MVPIGVLVLTWLLVELIRAVLRRRTPDHRCRYSSGEAYPEHCVYCGRDVRDDPSYRRAMKAERAAARARGRRESPWAS